MSTATVIVDTTSVKISAQHPDAAVEASRARARGILVAKLRESFATAATKVPPRVRQLREQWERQNLVVDTAARRVRAADAELARLKVDPDESDHLHKLGLARTEKTVAEREHADAVEGLKELTEHATRARESASDTVSMVTFAWKEAIRVEYEAHKAASKLKVERLAAELFAKLDAAILEHLAAVAVIEAAFLGTDWQATSELDKVRRELTVELIGTPIVTPTAST